MTEAEKSGRLTIRPSDIKRLFAYTGNQCAIPNCTEVLVDPSGTMLGKIAHIAAAEPGGARYDAAMTDEMRRHMDNLIIVCGKHHDIIDDKNNIPTYTLEILKQYKETHESRFKKAEKQLLARFVDMTQATQPNLPKTLKRLAQVTGIPEMIGHPDELKELGNFIRNLSELPREQRAFSIKLAERMRRRKVESLPVEDVEGAFEISARTLTRHMKILENHELGSLDEAMGYDEWVVTLWTGRRYGYNRWIQILEFCDATGVAPDAFLYDLNFALYDS